MVSVGIGGKDVGWVTLPISKVWRPFAVNREFLTVFESGDKYADNCVRNTTFFESWNWLDWNSDVWSTISFNWGHIRWVARTIAMCQHLRIWMSRIWMGMGGLLAAAILMAICALYYFLTFFLWYLFPERAAHSKSAMIVAIFSVNTFYNHLTSAWRCGVIFELVTFAAN